MHDNLKKTQRRQYNGFSFNVSVLQKTKEILLIVHVWRGLFPPFTSLAWKTPENSASRDCCPIILHINALFMLSSFLHQLAEGYLRPYPIGKRFGPFAATHTCRKIRRKSVTSSGIRLVYWSTQLSYRSSLENRWQHFILSAGGNVSSRSLKLALLARDQLVIGKGLWRYKRVMGRAPGPVLRRRRKRQDRMFWISSRINRARIFKICL